MIITGDDNGGSDSIVAPVVGSVTGLLALVAIAVLVVICVW